MCPNGNLLGKYLLSLLFNTAYESIGRLWQPDQKLKATIITCCFIHLEFWCGCLVTVTAQKCIFHGPVRTSSPALLLFASSALSAGTQARPCVNPEPCAHPAGLSSTWSSWAALSQSRELDYPLALKLHPLSFSLGRGWEAAQGSSTQISHLLIKKDFSHILTGQMDGCFEKQCRPSRIFPQAKNKRCWTVKILITGTDFVNPSHFREEVVIIIIV